MPIRQTWRPTFRIFFVSKSLNVCSNYNLKKLAVAVPLRAKTKAIRFGIAFVLHLRDRRTLLKAEAALVCLQANLATDFLCLFVSEPLNCVRQLQFIKACRRCSVARQNKSDAFRYRFCFALKGPKNPHKAEDALVCTT